MAYRKGDKLWYVAPSGDILSITASSDEHFGALDIVDPNGKEIVRIGTFHLFSTLRAAEIAANQRFGTGVR